jgi:ATP-dependent Clp protease ATP-binding subunit ClpX
MLSDYFRLIDLRKSGRHGQSKPEESSESMALERRIEIGIQKARPARNSAFLLGRFREYNLTAEERLVAAAFCYFASKPECRADLGDIFDIVCQGNRVKMIKLRSFLNKGTNLFKAEILSLEADQSPFHRDSAIKLSPKAAQSLWGYDITDRPPKASGHKVAQIEMSTQAALAIRSPQDVYVAISEQVVGQEEAKRCLAVAVYNHYQRINGLADVAKSNILMAGPTGCGKTLLAETVSRILDVPLIIADANRYSETGYIGDDVQDILYDLYRAAGNNPERAAKGIVYIDEIDKIAAAYDSGKHRSNRDVSGESVQAELLKVIEGGDGAGYPFDTSQVLFMAGGAFSGLLGRGGRSEPGNLIGFGREDEAAEKKKSQAPDLEDFIAYGMLPELMGRFQVRLMLDGLDRGMLRRILAEPRDSIISQYQSLFKANGIELAFTSDALDRLAEWAQAQNLGARGLKSAVERVLNPLMFQHFGQASRGTKLVVDGLMVERCKFTRA